MSKEQLCTLFLFISFLEISLLQKVEKRLSPIQIKSDETELPSEVHDKQNEKHIMNIKDSLKGKVVEMTPLRKKENLEADDSDYDSLDDIQYIDEENHDSPILRGKKNIKQWDHWGKWSDCSVSCGVGKMTRWRHCVSEDCAPGEKEAQIKTCALKPCP